MAELKEKVKTGLDEARILVLGAQVLTGFQLRAVFETGFEKLPRASQYMLLGSLALLLVALALIMSPGAYHRLVTGGEDTEDLHRFTTRVLGWALLPFALGLGIGMYVATEKLRGQLSGAIAGVAVAGFALTFWYVIEAVQKSRQGQGRGGGGSMAGEQKDQEGGTELKDKINHVLTEARMILPGAQALLGFQFAIMLVEAFDKLPSSSKYIHLACFALTAVTIVFLITPAAYHRIVEQGEDTERFHRFASVMLVAAMVPLALGVSGDFFVVARKVTKSDPVAIVCAVAALLFFYGLWFGFMLVRRSQKQAA